MSIGALIVIYNPDEDVFQNIDSFISEIDKLLIFDNSEMANTSCHKELSRRFPSKIEIVSKNTNVGIGAALNFGVQWALKNEYSWLLTMDQDSSFRDRTYFEEFALFSDKENVAVFSPNHSGDLGTAGSSASNICDEIIVMTSGNILNLEIYRQVGPFTDKLFIDEVDHDYCLRSHLLGFRIVRFKNAFLNHSLGAPLVVDSYRGRYTASQHSPTRIYYITRNNLYIFQRYFLQLPKFILRRVFNLLILYRDIVLYHQDKRERIEKGLLGVFHFIKGRYGKL
jgi:rhamnosyltransferase